MDRSFPPTRAAALARLHDFTPEAGRDYANGRNTDHGPGGGTATSALSPYLRRRMLTEAEVIAATLDAQGPENAFKFVQEVFWRSYFKGHLETRPALWTDYLALAADGHAQLAANAGLRRAYDDATQGRTGIDCLDDWSRELTQTHWLHNHTRMWFASIWIFTLRLPWALGAEFFMRHLVDGDPASNTLSWRWVAGLHTRGKPYAARAENIRRYTAGRYDPHGLNEEPEALEEANTIAPRSLPPAAKPPTGDVALLLHLDDLNPETLPLDQARVARVAGLVAHADHAADRVTAFDRDAMADALDRAAAHFGCPAVPLTDGWAEGLPVVAAYAPAGPTAAAMPNCVVDCLTLRRSWDSATWPHSTRGFFQLKTAIPRVIERELSR